MDVFRTRLSPPHTGFPGVQAGGNIGAASIGGSRSPRLRSSGSNVRSWARNASMWWRSDNEVFDQPWNDDISS